MRHLFPKLTLLLVFLTFAGAFFNISTAQQLPNAGFEQWNGSWNGKPQPDGWNLSNVEQVGLKFNVGERTSDAHSGSYAVKCQGTEVGAMGITAVSPSWVTLGTSWAYLDGLDVGSATAGTTGGISWGYRPDTLAVWIKRTSAGNEDMNLVYYSWRGTAYNDRYKNKDNGCTETGRTDEESDICKSDINECKTPSGDAVQVAEGWLRTKTQYPAWTRIKLPIKYFNNDIPTKMNVILSASRYPEKRANSGQYTSSVLIVDDISMIYASDIHEIYFDGKKYSNFNKDKREIYYEVPVGKSLPEIVCKRSGRKLSGSEISIVNGVKDGTPAVITVRAEDGSSTTEYKVYFVSVRDINPYPSTIKVNGTAISGFNAYASDYTVTLPYGTTETPVIDVVKANNKQTVKIEPYSVPGTAKITVFAENDEYTAVYNIKFEIGKLNDTTLKDIQVNGVSIDGFSPTKTIYTVDIPEGTTDAPEITPVSAYEPGAQTIVIDRKGIKEPSTVTVSAPGTISSRVYKISYNVIKSKYSYLKDLKVAGVTIENFTPAVLSYTYPLPIGTPEVPAVTYTPGDAYQTITKEDGGLDGITKITVKAQNGINTSIYRISFPLSKSSNSKLTDLKVAGKTIEGFSSDVTSYSYKLATGTTILPEITWTQGDEYQSVKATYGGVNGTTKIVVTAQDGTATVYTIAFSVDQATNSTLRDIQLDGVSLEDFAPDKTEYSILLTRGTKTLPVITYTPYDEFQKITKVEGGVNGDTKITVKAQSGDMTVYVLSFSVDKSTNSYLSDLLVAGKSIDGFASDKFEYDYKLNPGTISVPDITYVQGDDYQMVIVVKGGVNDASAIRVTAESGDITTYTINFSVEKSENANLKNILLNGVSLEGFSPEIYNYEVLLPVEATESPAVSVEKEATQTVSIVKPALFGTAYIDVIPEEGAKNIYTIKFLTAKGSNCELADIQVAGETVEGFNPDVTTYNITLPQGTTALPSISYTKGDETQSVELAEGDINSASTISVMSENGSIKVYTLNFTTEKSSDGLLSDILIDEESIEGFASDKYEYTYIMAKGTAERPSVVAVKSNGSSRVDAVYPYLDGDVKFYVKSEDGTSESLYTVHLVYAIDKNANLSEIKVGGEAIALVEDQYTYNVEGSFETVPTVEYTKASKTQRVILNNNISGATLDVKAEDGTSVTYTINYNKVPGTNASLSDLQYFDGELQQFVSIEGFASDKYEYEITLPLNASDIYTLNCVGAAQNQTYQISYASINEVTKIKVTAEDGETTADYSVKFIATKSNVCTLDDITIGGEQVPEFSSEITEYEITLPAGDTQRGLLRYVKSDAKSLVVVKDDVYNATSEIVVIAEDGTEKSYKLSFKQGFTGKSNVLKSIIVNGAAMTDFDPQVFVYNVDTYSGIVPNIYCEKEYEEQSLHIATSEQGKTVITVKSNQEGVADAVYTLNHNVKQPYNVLTSIKIDGKIIDGFNPYKTKYVVLVTKTPETVIAEGAESEKTINTASHVRFETAQSDVFASVKYDIFFHYTTDEVDGTFEQSVMTKYNNKNKPQGWNCPADFVEGHLGSYTSGSEVNITTNYHSQGSKAVQLKTVYLLPSAESMFGCMSLSKMSFKLGSYEVLIHFPSENSFGEGITYRNSPDKMSMDFYPVANNKISEWHFIYKFKNDAGTTYTNTYKGSYATKNTWQTMNLDLNYPAEFGSPSSLDIIVNSAATETLSDMYVGTSGASDKNRYTSTLIVDNLKFFYNSEISAIKVNGIAATMDKTAASVTIDSECSGNPVIDITGKVEDQMYDIDYGTEVNGVRVVNIRSYAEDMSYTDYTLTVTRPLSTQNELKDIKVEGVSLTDFDASKLDYEYSLTAGKHIVPNVTVNGKSSHQNLSMSMSGSVLSIVSTSESGESKTYTVTFIEEKISSADLTSLSVAGKEISFDPAQTEYAVELEPRTVALPEILYSKISDKQSVVMTEGGVNGVTTLAVKSADASTEKEYKIAFSVTDNKSTTSKLSSMSVIDAVNPIEFDPDTKDYTFDIAEGETPVANYGRAFREDSMVVTLNRDSVMWSLHNSLSETEMDYKLTYYVVKSSNSHLAGVRLAGESVEDFNPNLTEYNWSVERNEVPTIDAIMAEAGQAVETVYDEDAGTYAITVTAPDGVSATTYNIKVSVKSEAEAKAAKITLDGVEISGYDPEVTVYNVDMPVGTERVPEIYGYCGNGGSSAVMTVKSINEVSEITITSEDGTSAQTYYIGFNVKKSDDATLRRLSSNFAALADFTPDRFEYEITVPVGCNDPVMTYLKNYKNESVSEESTADGYKIEVISENGDVTNVYKVMFNRIQASGSDLADITLDGNSIEGFEPTKYEYSIELPEETTVLPVISTVSGDYGQNVTVLTNGVNGDAVVTSKSQDGSNTSVYTLHFSVAKSTNSYLNLIMTDGEPLEGFFSDKFDYNVTLELGRTTLPEVTYIKGHVAQTVAENVTDSVVTLTVTAEKGNTTVYTIAFEYNLSKADTLKMVYISGDSVKEFSPSVFEYDVKLPLGRDLSKITVDSVDYQMADEWQTVEKSFADNIFTLNVKAQDTVYQNRYTIHLSVEKSTNTKLSDLMSGGKSVPGFKDDVLDYFIELPVHTKTIPDVTYKEGDEYQVIEQSESEDRKIQKVKVTAQNGKSRTYTVTYTIKLSDNANLNSIKLDDVLIPGFDPETYKYEFELPYNTKKVPAITYEQAEPEQIVVEDYTEDLNGTSYIKVTAEDGVTVNTYSIAFSVAKSDVTTLDMIYYDGKAIEHFDKEDNNYDVDLPYGTVKAPNVTWNLTQPVETAILSMTEVEDVGWDAVIEVTAEDGISRNEYTVHFIVALDSENRLSDIKVFGKTISGFDKNVVNYDIVLPAYSDSTLLPKVKDVEYTRMSRNEIVVVSQPTVESIIIDVTAQDGSQKKYVIKTTIALSSNASLSSLMISDKVLPGFAPDVLDYEYRIEFGSTYVDTAKYVISYILQEPQGQSVTIQHKMDKHGEEDPFTYIVTVVAQDKTEKQYTIHFVPDTFDPTTEPTATDVCITSTADGGWKFVTKCKNITVILNDLNGRVIATATLPTVDPNIGEICDPNAEGFTYYAPQDQLVAYRFMYAQKKRVLSGKFKGQRR
ncbi:MAG: hypothetical protein MJ009_05545 [Paludibacteraceae bacterium]|nr:hypothetical protein [Paludibacteraceae bacterium]